MEGGKKEHLHTPKLNFKNTKHPINKKANERLCFLKTYLNRNLYLPALI